MHIHERSRLGPVLGSWATPRKATERHQAVLILFRKRRCERTLELNINKLTSREMDIFLSSGLQRGVAMHPHVRTAYEFTGILEKRAREERRAEEEGKVEGMQ